MVFKLGHSIDGSRLGGNRRLDFDHLIVSVIFRCGFNGGWGGGDCRYIQVLVGPLEWIYSPLSHCYFLPHYWRYVSKESGDKLDCTHVCYRGVIPYLRDFSSNLFFSIPVAVMGMGISK